MYPGQDSEITNLSNKNLLFLFCFVCNENTCNWLWFKAHKLYHYSLRCLLYCL